MERSIRPNADPTDGLLDITMVHSASRTKLVRLFPTVFKGTHIHLDEVKTDRAKTVYRLKCPGINAYADGEFAMPAAGGGVGSQRRAEDSAARPIA